MADDIEAAERLARIETKLDTVLTTLPDHETRIRIVEQKKEECQQDERLDKIETKLTEHDSDIQSLKSTHAKDQGAKEASMSYRELAAWGLSVSFGIITIYQFVKGGL